MKAPQGMPGIGVSTRPTVNGQQDQSNGQVGYQQGPLDALKSLYRSSTQRAQSYDQTFNNIYEDKTLEALREAAGGDNEESIRYYRQHGSMYAAQFVEEVKGMRNGLLHRQYRQRLDNYGDLMRENSTAKKEFIKLINKRLDILETITLKISFWFGSLMGDTVKKAKGQQIPMNTIVNNLDLAIINILDLECIAWLHGSKKGKEFLYYPSPDITQLITKFEEKKARASLIFQFFEEASPYDSMNFGNDGSEMVSMAHIVPEYAQAGKAQYIDFGTGETEQSRLDAELLRIPYELAQARRKQEPTLKQVQKKHTEEAQIYYGEYADYRTDLNEINMNNRNEFNIRSYFKSTGLTNWYHLDPKYWRYLSKVLKPNPANRAQESVLRGQTLFVNYDFDNERDFPGWTIKVFKLNPDEKDMILSDPEKLIKLFEEEQVPEEVKMKVFDRTAFLEREKEGNEELFNEFREAEFEYRVVANNEQPKSVVNQAFLQDSLNVGVAAFEELSSKPIAIFDHIVAEGKFIFENEFYKERTLKALPCLFKGIMFDNEYSYFGIVEHIRKVLKSSKYNSEDAPQENNITAYVNQKLTIDFNNWLISVCGYTSDRDVKPHLDITDIFEDLEGLKKYLCNTDKEVYQILNEPGAFITLRNQIRMFDNMPETDTLDLAEKKEQSIGIVKNREYHIITICNEYGPTATKGNTNILRRSSKPEFFALVDKLAEQLKAKDRHIEDTNILFYFGSSRSLFSFSHAVYDKNVCILRPISWQRTLLNPLYL